MKYIEVKDLSFGYTEEKVINKLNLSVNKGEVVVIIGENGSGKSTLLKLLLGEHKASSGEIKVFGEDINNLKSFRDIGYVPQLQTMNQISFPVTVSELVCLSLYSDFGAIKIPKKAHKKRTLEVLNEMGIGEYFKTPINELSGGLRQRTMIARAMINKPRVLILDEPTAGVDQESKENFLKLISSMKEKEDITIIIVTHELDVIKDYIKTNNIYKMEGGALTYVGV